MFAIVLDVVAFVFFIVIFLIFWAMPELVTKTPKTLEKPLPTEEEVFIPIQFSSENFPSYLFSSILDT